MAADHNRYQTHFQHDILPEDELTLNIAKRICSPCPDTQARCPLNLENEDDLRTHVKAVEQTQHLNDTLNNAV